MSKHLQYFGFILFTLIGCGPSGVDSNFRNIKIKFIESVQLSDLIEEDFTYLPLEADAKSHSLIGDVHRMTYTDSSIYILDSKISKRFYSFDHQGNLNFVGGRVGQGPGEYGKPSDMIISADRIKIHDGTKFSILNYDSQGNFLNEQMIGLWIQEMIPFSNNQYLICSPTDYVTDEELKRLTPEVLKVMSDDFGEINASFFPYEEVIDDAALTGLLSSFDDSYLYSRPVLGQIYELNSDLVLTGKYQFDFGSYSWPIDVERMKNDQDKVEELFFKGNIMTMLHRICENKKYITFQTYMISANEVRSSDYYDENDKWLCVLDKQTEKCYAFKKVLNDIDGGTFTFPLTTYKEDFVSIIEPALMTAPNFQKAKNLEKKEEFIEIKASLDDSSNPVLMKFRFKSSLDFPI